MESKPEQAAGTAATQTHKQPLPESVSSGEGAASALSRLRTIEKAEADCGLGSLADRLEGPDSS